MNKIKYGTILIIACLVCMVLFSGCQPTPNTYNSEGDTTMNCYKIDDFESITIGESTYQEIYKIAPTESMRVTSYGGFLEYPTNDGNKIVIKFYGPELIVGSIEIVNNN